MKELRPIILSVAVWGKMWRGRAVRCRCDNVAMVAALNSGTSNNERAMHLVRSLFFFAACQNLSLVRVHIPGVENGAVEALSRNDCSSFHSQISEAKLLTPLLPPELVQVLMYQQPD